MLPLLLLLLSTVLLLALPPLVSPQSVITVPSNWSYDPESPRGPSQWSTLDPSFGACASGREQSPIDLPSSLPHPASPSLAIHWDDLHSSIASASSHALPPNSSSSDLHHLVNTGHSIQVKFDGPTVSHVTLASTPYSLLQFHFHSPSEHLISGHPHDLELHLVHSSADGRLLVVGVLIDADPDEVAEAAALGTDPPNSASSFLRSLAWAHLPATQQPTRPSRRPLLHSLQAALSSPASAPAFYAYAGSLTTPPCTEGVQWFVSTRPLHISPAELAAYRRLFDRTARPVQPLGARAVTAVTTPSAHSIGPALLVAGLVALVALVAVVWLCTRSLQGDSLQESLRAAVQENVQRDKEADEQWKREREREGGVGAGQRGRPTVRVGRRGGSGGLHEEDPLLSSYPAPSFPGSGGGGAGGPGMVGSGSPLTRMLRRSANSRAGSSGNLSDSWRDEKKAGEEAVSSSPKDTLRALREGGR